MAGHGWTNTLKAAVLGHFFRGSGAPTSFYIALCTAATAPTADTETLSELTEIAAGNGYASGGMAIARASADFDTLTQDDNGDQAIIYLKNLVWSASGGAIPASGAGARYAVLTGIGATVGDRVVYHWWDLGEDRSVADGNNLTLVDAGIKIGEPS